MKKKIVSEKKGGIFSKKKIFGYSVGGFIILLMVASALNMSNDEEEKYDYHGLKFVKTDQGSWIAYQGSEPIQLLYHPQDLDNITLPDNVGLISYSPKIYLSTDDLKANGRVIGYFKAKIGPNAGITDNQPYACTNDAPGCEELPLKSCLDAAQGQTGIVVFKRANETKITYKDGCLTMEGSNEELPKAVDKIYLALKGI